MGPVELAQAGRYTLLFEGRYNRSDNTSYSFVVQPLQDSSAALQLGQVVNASIAKGQSQRYNFTLTGDVRAYFDSLTRDVAGADSYYLNWSLSGPRGTVVADRPFRQSDSLDGTSILDLVAGDYTLTVTSTNEIAGNYSFRLADLAQATAIATGAVVDGTLAPSNETDVYRFDAAAGESFYFDRISRNGGDIYWRLLDPYGRTVFGPTYIDSDAQIGVRTLEVTGSYTLLVEGRYYTAGDASYSFRVQPVQNETLALNLNEVQNQSIAHKGQVDTFTFSLSEAKRLYFDSLTADVSGADSWYLRWSLEGPAGVLASDQPFRGSDSYEGLSVFDLGPGDYRLTVRGTNDIAGNYAFRLLDLSSAPLLATGTPVSGVLNPASETEAYRFAAAAGDRLLLRSHRQQRRRHLLASAGPVRQDRLGPDLDGQRRGCHGAALRRRLYAADRRPLLRRRARRTTPSTSRPRRCRPRWSSTAWAPRRAPTWWCAGSRWSRSVPACAPGARCW